MKKILLMALVLLNSACASNGHVKQGQAEPVQKAYLPQIWSGHKVLSVSTSVCAEKGVAILNSLGFKKVTTSSHGNYVYGNYSSNRAAIKCVDVNGKAFVYSAVAGEHVKTVERLRNEIMWQY